MSSNTRAQYRPSLSLAELQELVSYIPKQSVLYSKLYIYLAKANLGLNAAAYTAEPKETIEEKLGLQMAGATVVNKAAAYTALLQQKQELAPATMSKEDRFNLLGAKAMAAPPTITEEEREEGKQLEIELYGMELGTFS